MSRPRSPSAFLAPAALMLASALLAGAASAGTWQWRDASGRMVYSDLPPPPEVRTSQIVRAPVSAQVPPAGAAAAADSATDAGDVPRATGMAAAATAAPAAAKPHSWIEKEAEFRKRTLERQEAERKEQAQRDQAAASARACEQSRATLRTLESGMRMTTIAPDGERQVLDERERTRRIEELRSGIARDCARPGG